MTFKTNIDTEVRGFYFANSGKESFAGDTLERPKLLPQSAINAAGALIPTPSIPNPAQVSAAQGGTFDSGFSLPGSVNFDAMNSVFTVSQPIGIVLGDAQICSIFGITNTNNNSTCMLNDGKSLAGSRALFCVAAGDDSIGYEMRGETEGSFTSCDRLRVAGARSIGFKVVGDLIGAMDIDIDVALLNGVDSVFLEYNPNSSTDTCVVDISTVFSSGATIDSKGTATATGYQVKGGHLTVNGGILLADVAVHVESGAVMDLNQATVVGDIIVDAGGVLNASILNHEDGTITNNGTINGKIGEIFYGPVDALRFADETFQSTAAMQDGFQGFAEAIGDVINTYDLTSDASGIVGVNDSSTPDDGKNTYVLADDKSIYQYDNAPSWGLSTPPTYSGFSFVGSTGNSSSIWVEKNRLRAYLLTSQGKIRLFAIADPSDISTASFVDDHDATTELASSRALHVLDDESFFYAGDNAEMVFKYSIATIGTMVGAAYTGESMDLSGTSTVIPGGLSALSGLYFSPDKRHMYVTDSGVSPGIVYQILLSSPGTLDNNAELISQGTTGVGITLSNFNIKPDTSTAISTDSSAVELVQYKMGLKILNFIETVLFSSSFANQVPTALDTPLQIEFGAAQGSSTDPVQLAVDGAVTINETGQYFVNIVLQYGRSGSGGVVWLFFRSLIDGVQAGNSLFAKLSNSNEDTPAQFEGVFDFEEGQVLTIEMVRDSQGTDLGQLLSDSPTLGDWNDAASAFIRIGRRQLL